MYCCVKFDFYYYIGSQKEVSMAKASNPMPSLVNPPAGVS